MKQVSAQFYEPCKNKTIVCTLCPIGCRIKPGAFGRCQTRLNRDGSLIITNYGEVTALNIDPIEKKPLYHFLPGSQILSLGNKGCNLQCRFCQNWQISQTDVPTRFISPEDVVALVKKHHLPSVAFTYAEPVIWFEYIVDCAMALKKESIKTVLVSNGMINRKPLEKLLPLIDAFNIDIKSMDTAFYSRICNGILQPVLDSCTLIAKQSHLEITNLIISNENDSITNFEALVNFISHHLGSSTPLHLSRYYPSYQMTQPATPIETMKQAYDIAGQKLKYVYLGNVPEESSNSTSCNQCGKILVDRSGYSIRCVHLNLENGQCSHCGCPAEFVTA